MVWQPLTETARKADVVAFAVLTEYVDSTLSSANEVAKTLEVPLDYGYGEAIDMCSY